MMKLVTLFVFMLGFAASAGPVTAQEILPFRPKPSGSTADRTMQESVYSPGPEAIAGLFESGNEIQDW